MSCIGQMVDPNHSEPPLSKTPVITTDADGRIRQINKAAKKLFGDARGRRCGDVMVARDATRRIVCTQQCAKSLIGDCEQRDLPQVTVRGEDYRMMCTGLEGGAVVTLLDAVITEPVREPLTPRELEILAMVSEGLTSKRIARRLGISFSTVRTHLERARSKLGARSRAEAVARAVRTGQLSIDAEREAHTYR
jgi:DNA-binding CsgD family transcriptional regulator